MPGTPEQDTTVIDGLVARANMAKKVATKMSDLVPDDIDSGVQSAILENQGVIMTAIAAVVADLMLLKAHLNVYGAYNAAINKADQQERREDQATPPESGANGHASR